MAEQQRKQRKPPKPLKILVNLFAKSGKGGKQRGGNEETGTTLAPSPPIVIHDDARSSSLLSPGLLSSGVGGASSPSYGAVAPDSLSVAASAAGGGTLAAVGSAGEITELYTEMEALHLSRQDNPFIQKTGVSASQDNLDDIAACREQSMSGSFTRCGSQSVVSGSHSMMSPEPPWPNSPTRSCDPLVLEEVHSHLIRSPPPVNWPSSAAVDRGGGAFPLSPRSTNGTFSPDSSDGLEIDCNSNNNANLGGGSNYYVRSHSEEHILSPCRDLLRTGMHGVGIGGGGGPASPPHLQHNQLSLLQRGATPDLLMTTSLYAGVGAGDGGPGSPRPSSSVQQQMQMQQQQQQQIQQLKHQKIRRNHTLNLSTDVLGGGDFYYSAGPASASSAVNGATSVSSYAMNLGGGPAAGGGGGGGGREGGFSSGAHHRRSLGARPATAAAAASKKLSAPASAGPGGCGNSSGGEGFFSSMRSSRQRRRTSESHPHQQRQQPDAKSMENLQVDSQSNLNRLACSPSARKSIASIGGVGLTGGGGVERGASLLHSPRNAATLFTKWRVRDPPPLFIT